MKKTILGLLITGFISTSILTSCHSPAEKVMEAKDELSEAKDEVVKAKVDLKESLKDSFTRVQSDSLAGWKKFRKEMEEKINDNEKQLAELRTSIDDRYKDMKADYQKAVGNLEQKNENLKNRLANFKDYKKESLNAFKQRFNNDINEVTRSVKNIK